MGKLLLSNTLLYFLPVIDFFTIHMPVDCNKSKLQHKPCTEQQEEVIRIGELMSLCEKMEFLSLKHGDSETALDLSQMLFRIQLRRVETVKVKQTSLDNWFSSTVTLSHMIYTYLHLHKSNDALEIGLSQCYAL